MKGKGKRYSEEQILKVLKEAETAESISDVCRRHGISDTTFYNWRTKYGGMDISEMRRLKSLEQENAKLKRIVTQQVMDIDSLKELLSKKW